MLTPPVFAVLAGAKIPGGTLYGQSDQDAAYAVDRPVSPEDSAATVYHASGIDPETRIPNFENRPTQIVEGGHAPVLGLWS